MSMKQKNKDMKKAFEIADEFKGADYFLGEDPKKHKDYKHFKGLK